MPRLRLCFYIIVQTWVIVNCEIDEIEDARRTVSFTEDAEETQFVDPHSFDYDRSNKKMIERRKVDYQWSEGTCASDGQCRSELKQCTNALDEIEFDRIYTVRLINMLLAAAKFQEDGDTLSGSINLFGQKADVEKLRVFGEGNITMREVDVILSNMITPATGVITETIMLVDRLLLNVSQYWEIIVAACTAVVILQFIKYVNWSTGKVIVVFLAFGFLVSYLMIYSQLKKEAEIKRWVTLRQNKEPPIECDPENMSFWAGIVSRFNGRDQCFEYYKAIELEPIHEVTPLDVLPEVFDRLILQLIPRIGSGVDGFIENATKHLPWPLNWIVKTLLYLVIILGIILYMIGGNLRIWGPFFGMSIGSSGRNRHQPPAVASENRRERITDIPRANIERNRDGEPKQLAPSTAVKSIDDNQPATGGGDSKTQQQLVKEEDAGTVCRGCCCKNSLNKSHIVDGEDLENKATKSDVRKEDKGDGDC